MSRQYSRRDGLRLGLAGVAAGAVTVSASAKESFREAGIPLAGQTTSPWRSRFDRMWIGGEYWSNPMEDWRLRDGGVETTSPGGNRSVHSLVHQIADPQASFRMSVRVRNLGSTENDGGASIRIGIRSDIDEYRANCFVQSGIDAGVRGDRVVLAGRSAAIPHTLRERELELRLSGMPRSEAYALTLALHDAQTGEALAAIEEMVWPDSIRGNIALVSNFAVPSEGAKIVPTSRYRFADWTVEGQALTQHAERRFGPILWAMYTLGDTGGSEGLVLKMTALTGPLGDHDDRRIELQVKRDADWVSLGLAPLDTDAWTATFRVPRWQGQTAVPYRLIYRERLRDGSVDTDTYAGTIAANPVGRPLRLAALTCQNDYAFPYEPVTDNVQALKPDMILFSGDQIYENHGGYGAIRAPAERAIPNYLRKYYQFGWAFREAMRHAPTVCMPDDHDMLQGNIWGEGGAPVPREARATGRTDNHGGYIEPARVVNAIHRSQVSHLPDPIDPQPVKQGISTYHTVLLYGGVSFAILADRMWKSGPERLGIVVGETGNDEDPLSYNPALDRADLELLGTRQERFLREWGKDWRSHTLKAVLSQTVFAGISTHQPLPDRFLKYDFDSSGWPRTARDRAVVLLRDAKALHICGDTHLGSLSQYGVGGQRNAGWAFCTPAIAAGWPRWWKPDAVGMPMANRPAHGLPETGEYTDSFGNPIYVYAVGNPEVGTAANRYLLAHQKGSGFGMVEFDTAARTYTMHAWRFLAEPAVDPSQGQFPGWPVTIAQEENAGRNRLS